MQQNILGIDFGKNIGLAIAIDKIALPLFITRSLIDVATIIKEKKINFLVIGWPLLLNGEVGNQCIKTEKMLHNLLKLTGQLSYHLQDERFSSKFVSGNHSNSAAWILQLFLDSDKLILNS